MSYSDEILNRIRSSIYKLAPDAEIILYGSRARGDARKMSDWDLLILLNTEHLSFSFETSIIDNLYHVELETGEVISPLLYTKKDWFINHSITPLYENIQREGIKI